MTEFLHGLHSGLRYLVLLAGLASIVVSAIGWQRSRRAGTMRRLGAAGHNTHGVGAPAVTVGAERPIMGVFVGLLDTQVLVGVLLLFMWPFYGALIGHITMMVLAAAVAHTGSIMARRRAPQASGSGIRLSAVVIALVLIVGGILAIQRPVL